MIRPALVVLLAGAASYLGGDAHRRTEKGNSLYLQGKHEQALEQYGQAQVLVPGAPQIPYDIGNVLYRQENYPGAAEAYERALGAAAPDLAAKAAYNLGNALYKDGKFDEAVKAYVRSLKADPRDADTKRNLELALRALEEKKKQQKQQPQQQQGKQDKQQQQDKQAGQQDKKQDKQQDKQDPQQQGGDDKQGPKDDKQQGRPNPKGGMSPEEAKRLLDRVADQERDDRHRDRARVPAHGDISREKDW